MKIKLLSVVICTYNREKFILESLNSIAHQEIKNFSFELVIINNNSTDNSPILIKEFIDVNSNLNIKYIIETNQGLSFARNRGIKESSGDIIIFLDDDAIACKDYLKNVYDFFEKFSDVSVMGGKILPKFENKQPNWASKYLMPVFSVIDLGNNYKPFKKNSFPIGANMAFKNEVFIKYGSFNTQLGRKGKLMEGSEEKDLINRLKQKGEKILYNPHAWVYHIIPETRCKISFLKKQAYGIGYSERIRVSQNSITFLKKIISEIIKWGASFLLFFLYSFSFQTQKAKVIIQFRWWVSNGFMFKKLG